MWAEWYRHLAERAVPPNRAVPRDVWRYRVPSGRVADLGDAERLALVGLAMPVPGRRTWPPYQEVGETLWGEGWDGLVAPSAARPDGRVLCLFVVAGRIAAKPVGRPRVVAAPPAPPTGMRT